MTTFPARQTDPASSHEAAREVTKNGTRQSQCERVLDLVRAFQGYTSLELARGMWHRESLDRYVVARRLPQLEEAGLVRRGPIRECRVGHRPALTWFPADPKQPRQMELEEK